LRIALALSVPEYGQALSKLHTVLPLPSNDLARLSFGDESALYNGVNAREQLDGRPNLIVIFKLFSRTSQYVCG
jgi:hypothetical protein